MAKKDKVSFLFYYDYLEQFKELTSDEIIEMIEDMILYDRDGIEPTYQDRTLRSIWNFIKRRMDIDKSNYQKTCEKNKKNIEERWKKKILEQNSTKNTNGINGKKNIPLDTIYTDIDKEKDIDNNIVCNIKEENVKEENSNFCQFKREYKIESCETCLKNKICPLKTASAFLYEKGCSFEEWLAKKQTLCEQIVNTPHDPPSKELLKEMEELKDYNWMEDNDD